MRVGLLWWHLRPLYEKRPELSLPYEDTALSASQEENPHQNPAMLAPWSWISSLQNCEKSVSAVWAPVCGVLTETAFAHSQAPTCVQRDNQRWPDIWGKLPAQGRDIEIIERKLKETDNTRNQGRLQKILYINILREIKFCIHDTRRECYKMEWSGHKKEILEHSNIIGRLSWRSLPKSRTKTKIWKMKEKR